MKYDFFKRILVNKDIILSMDAFPKSQCCFNKMINILKGNVNHV